MIKRKKFPHNKKDNCFYGEEEMEFTLKDMLRVIKRFIWFVAATTLACAVIAGAYTFFLKADTYLSTTKVEVTKGDADKCMTYIESESVLNLVVEKLNGKYNVSIDQLKAMISSEKVRETKFVNINVSDSDSGRTYWVCKYLVDLLDKGLANANSGVEVNVVNQPTKNPVKQSTVVRNTAVCGVLGFIVSLISVIVYSAVKKTIYRRSDIEKYFDLDVFGVLPNDNCEDALKVLGVNVLESSFGGDCKKVAVCGVGMSDDSNCAKDVAVALADIGRKTVYVDADITAEKENAFGVKAQHGLSDYLVGIKKTSPAVKTENKMLSVVTAGKVREDSAKLLASNKMKELLDLLAESYECVIVDCPSLSRKADGMAVHTCVDNYILSVSAGKDSISWLNNAYGSLTQLGVNVSGIVLTNANIKDVFGGRTFDKTLHNA